VGKVKKSDIPTKVLWEALCAHDDERRYNKGSVLYKYWLDNRPNLVGWSWNKFHSHIMGMDRNKVSSDYHQSGRRYGRFEEWMI
jgi:hypothetical protein